MRTFFLSLSLQIRTEENGMLLPRYLRLKLSSVPLPVFLLKQIFVFTLIFTLFIMIIRVTRSFFERSEENLDFQDENGNYVFDKWQDIGDPALKYQLYSAYFDDRLEVVGEANCKSSV